MTIDPRLAAVSGGIFLLFIILFIRQRRSGKQRAALRFSTTSQFKQAGRSWRVRFRWMLDLLRILAIAFLIIGFLRPRKSLGTIRKAREGIAIPMGVDRSSRIKAALSFHGWVANRP